MQSITLGCTVYSLLPPGGKGTYTEAPSETWDQRGHKKRQTGELGIFPIRWAKTSQIVFS